MYSVLNTCQGIYREVSFAGENCDVCLLLTVLAGVCLLLIVLCVELLASFLFVFWCLAFRPGVKKL